MLIINQTTKNSIGLDYMQLGHAFSSSQCSARLRRDTEYEFFINSLESLENLVNIRN